MARFVTQERKKTVQHVDVQKHQLTMLQWPERRKEVRIHNANIKKEIHKKL